MPTAATRAVGPAVEVDGKFFALGGERFAFRGVTYGTFRPRDSDGARFPEAPAIDADLAAMHEAGFTVLRTYTPPPEDLLHAADRHGLRVLAGVFYPDWRYLLGRSRADLKDVQRAAVEEVRAVTRTLARDPRVLALSVGNEVPADVLRWFGTGRISRVLSALVKEIHRPTPTRLVTYANYPTASTCRWRTSTS
jgi:beta-galactosidase/beta-glucuronidase